jgi:hypothetical protein
MADIAKLSVPLALVGTLLVSAVGAGITYGATRAELQTQTSKLDVATRKVETLEHEQGENREWRARVETQVGYLVRALDRLERRFGTKP